MTDMTLSGPANGRWVQVASTQRRVYLKCDLCDSLVNDGWKYYVNDTTSTATVCTKCADALLDN